MIRRTFGATVRDRSGHNARPFPRPLTPMQKTTTDNSTSFNELADNLTEQALAVRPIFLMSREERLAAFNRGDMTREQMFAWAARCPTEVPKLNGEFLFIAASTPEGCFRCPVCQDDEVGLAAGGVLAKHPDHRHTFDPADPYAHRPTCPASGITLSDAGAMRGSAQASPQESDYALAA